MLFSIASLYGRSLFFNIQLIHKSLPCLIILRIFFKFHTLVLQTFFKPLACIFRCHPTKMGAKTLHYNIYSSFIKSFIALRVGKKKKIVGMVVRMQKIK